MTQDLRVRLTTALVIVAVAVSSLCLSALAQNAQGDPYKELIEYDFGKSRVALTAIESEVRTAEPEQYGTIEVRLLEALESPEATFACKQFICRMLSRIGSDRSVAALAEMLTDDRLSHMARFALQRIPGTRVDAILREALGKLDGDRRIGVISSIGARGDRDAVVRISTLVTNRDAVTAGAAISALGRIGGEDATQTLRQAKVADDLENLRADAYLMCADSLLDEGDVSAAAGIYGEMARDTNPTTIRIAAYNGIVRVEKDAALPAVLALLEEENAEMRQAAAGLLAEIPGTAATKAIVEKLPAIEPAAQIVLLGKLADRGDKTFGSAADQAASSENEDVRVAAVRALAVLGDASAVKTLLDAATSGGATGDAAADSLARLSGPGVDNALARTIRHSDISAERAKAVEALAARNTEDAGPIVLRAAGDRDSSVRKAAYKALGTLAGLRELPNMAALLIAADNSADRSDLERAMISVVARIEDADSSAATLIAGLAQADDEAKGNLLVVLGRTGSDAAWRTIRDQLENTNVDIKKAAIRAMANWPNVKPADDLIDLAKNDPDPVCQILALQGYIRLIGLPNDRSVDETLAMYKAAMEVAHRPDEKKLVLAGVSNIQSRRALEFVEQYLEDEDIAAEVESARERIADMLE